MGLNEGIAGKVALPRWLLLAIIGTSVLATGVSGTMVYKAMADTGKPVAPRMSADESRLLARAEEEKLKKEAEAKKLRQATVGAGYQVDGEGNLTGPSENQDLPTNKSFDDIGNSGSPTDEIAKGIRGGRRGRPTPEPYEDPTYGGGGEGPPERSRDEETVQRTELEKTMLGYSTVKKATWAARRAEIQEKEEGQGGGEAGQGDGPSRSRAQTYAEQQMAALQNLPAPSIMGQQGGLPSSSAGPSKNGNDLMPAESGAQAFQPGGVGDMRIGGQVGKDQIVRQGKFIDCVVVNEIRADLVDSPVISMVSRDFISLDGNYVLVPAGSKLIGTAGKTQNMQQARVYIKFDRIIFPDQRSAFFPVRRLPAVDGAGSVGVDGDVDRHFMLMFGSAIMLGMLDGLAAAVQGPIGATNPTTAQLITARTSMNMAEIVKAIISRYGNVVPTITVEAGSKMKVFFAEDVRMSPYMTARELSWVRHGR